MQLTHEQHGSSLYIKANGRLDASWAEFFTDALLTHIRHGHHSLVLDVAEMPFLSSAGIRAMLRVYKELRTVNGELTVVNATSFVANTLITTGFQSWLSEEPYNYNAQAQAQAQSQAEKGTQAEIDENTFPVSPGASLVIDRVTNWQPWQVVTQDKIRHISFSPTDFALGIGCTAEQSNTQNSGYGEFLVVAGHVIYQPPEEKLRPDYLLAEGNFSPELLVIQSMVCRGEMAFLTRFAPDILHQAYSISHLAEMVLNKTQSAAVGFVILGEIEGLVGATLIQSPDKLTHDQVIGFPEIRNWLSFCGERAYSGQLALMFGIVRNGDPDSNGSNTKQSTASHHVHAAVFPYQPLQNGMIDLAGSVDKILNGPPPMAVLHLINDTRPLASLGESSLTRGACWYAPIKNPEGLI